MTILQDASAGPIHLEESERITYAAHGTLAPGASLTTENVWVVSSYGGLTRPPNAEEWLDLAAADIERWLNEPANWDGYGAQRISPVVANLVFGLLRRLARLNVPRPFITGTTDGGMNLQWDSDRYDLQVTIGTDYREAFYWDKRDNTQWEGPLERATLLSEALSALALK
jgi:hypothetical protein